MTLVDEAWIKKVCAIHKRFGIKCSYRNRGGKQYVKLYYVESSTERSRTNRSDYHRLLHRHIGQLFPTAHITSGGYFGGFDVTFRINP